ncbi:MAG: hypothetical protein B9S34_02815 [Opitutia bacterium Tous-C1TDCM]|nr:MAG: hypothetical protein B9S34_02815 [Opitutae bacterium Tous-C1TDCM]
MVAHAGGAGGVGREVTVGVVERAEAVKRERGQPALKERHARGLDAQAPPRVEEDLALAVVVVAVGAAELAEQSVQPAVLAAREGRQAEGSGEEVTGPDPKVPLDSVMPAEDGAGLGDAVIGQPIPPGRVRGRETKHVPVLIAAAAAAMAGPGGGFHDGITHTTFSGVNQNLFTIFETYDVDGSAVAIGLRNGSIIGGGGPGGGFVGGITPVPEPSTYGMMGALALVGATWMRRRKDAVAAATQV